MKKIFLVIISIFLLWATDYGLQTANAAVPHLINYQGWLTDSTGKAVPDGTHTVVFSIFDSESGGAAIWVKTLSVTTQKGIFNTILDLSGQNLAFDKQYWLQLKVNNEVMNPMQKITSAAYAIRAETAETGIRAQKADTLTDPTLLMPKGAIIMCKSNCAAGYKRIGELDGKFLVGGSTYNPQAGGNNKVTLGLSNLPAHSHNISHGHDAFVTRLGNARGGIAISDNVLSTQKSGLISDYSGNSDSTGEGQAFDIKPEYATVVLCEKE